MLNRFLCTFFLALFIFAPMSAQAQLSLGDIPLSSAELNSGQGVITSGLDANAVFENSSRQLYVRGNSTRFYIKHGWNLNDHVRIDASGGAFKLVPCIGPQLTFNLGPVTNYTWTGVSFGHEKLNLGRTKLMFWQNTTFVSAGPLLLSYSVLEFNVTSPDRVQHLVGVKFKIPVNSHFKGSLGITTELSGSAYTPLWGIGVTYSP